VGVPLGHLTHFKIAFVSVNGLADLPDITV